MCTVPSGRPLAPKRRITSKLRMPPTERSTLWMGQPWTETARWSSRAGAACRISCRSRTCASSWSCGTQQNIGALSLPPVSAECMVQAGRNSSVKSSSAVFQWSLRCAFGRRRSVRPMRSLNFRTPREAIISRVSSATMNRKLTRCSGWPVNFLRSSGSCVATPTGQVFRWHLRIMMQPRVMSGAVVMAISSAPSSAAMTTSRPVRTWPSVCRTTRSRRPLSTSVWCVSATPISQGRPQCLMEVHLAAPVPPDMPEMVRWSALPLTTPEAMTPMPMRATSFTETRAEGLAFLRSMMSCATSSIEYMSWWGGGEMRPTPGVAFRVSAILPTTL
mmetsp:Transcript_19113/g.60010  ORF Transcript_19113/g.60010 Transcript_19113/m.60010 type:complete len:332 (+) Transcript_19113:2666-3661(+)